MPSERRRMRPYHPRKSAHMKALLKQQIADLLHRLSADLGALLILLAEGSHEQAQAATYKAKSNLIKMGPDLKHLASQLGGKFPRAVDDYLNSMDGIVHSPVGWVDDAKVTRCYQSTERLEREIKAA